MKQVPRLTHEGVLNGSTKPALTEKSPLHNGEGIYYFVMDNPHPQHRQRHLRIDTAIQTVPQRIDEGED